MKPDNTLTRSRPMSRIAAQDGIVKLRPLSEPLDYLITGSAGILYEFFHANGYMVRRHDWPVQALSAHRGWVYAFYAKDVPFYIGETSRSFGERLDEHSRDDKLWFAQWDLVKILPCPDKALRKILESIVGLYGGYSENKMQPMLSETAFDDVTRCLLELGNDTGTVPTFLNEQIRDHVNGLSDLLGG